MTSAISTATRSCGLCGTRETADPDTHVSPCTVQGETEVVDVCWVCYLASDLYGDHGEIRPV